MKVFLGTEGLERSWQDAFKHTVICHKCGGKGRIMFVCMEEVKEKVYICDLKKNGGEGKYWPHDAIAVAVYLCKDCFEPIAVINQA
jgi:hypothetical protein